MHINLPVFLKLPHLKLFISYFHTAPASQQPTD